MTYDPIDTSATDNAADGSVTTDTLDATTLNNSGTATTQDLVVNGTATGVGGAFAPVLEAGDSITTRYLLQEGADNTFLQLYDGSAKDVLGGILFAGYDAGQFIYTFSDNSTISKADVPNIGRDRPSNDEMEIDFLPPALDVTKIEVKGNQFEGSKLGAEVLLKD